MSKKCSSCGAELPDNAKFCDKCGATVQETPNQKSYCPNCGFENEPGVKFCTKCGSQMDGSEKSQTIANSTLREACKKKKWPFVVGVIAVLVIVLAIIGGETDPVETVKNGYLTQYSSTVTIGEALNNRFDNGKWSSSENTMGDDSYSVFFTGYDSFTEADWTVAFYLEGIGDNNYLISVDSISAGGDTEYDSTNLYYLMSYIYTGNLNELYTDLGTALWNAILSY